MRRDGLPPGVDVERRLHGGQFRSATSRWRPKRDCRVAPKQPDGGPSLFMFRFHEAAVGDLTHPATSGHPIDQRLASRMTGPRVQLPKACARSKALIIQSGRSRAGGACRRRTRAVCLHLDQPNRCCGPTADIQAGEEPTLASISSSSRRSFLGNWPPSLRLTPLALRAATLHPTARSTAALPSPGPTDRHAPGSSGSPRPSMTAGRPPRPRSRLR